MQSARNRRDLGPDAFVDGDRVLCLPCKQASQSEHGTPISRSSWTGHIKTKAHLSAVAHVQQQQHRAREREQQYRVLYNSPAITLRNPPPANFPPTLPIPFQPSLGFDSNGLHSNDFEFDDDNIRTYFSGPNDDVLAQEEQEELLAREIRLLRLEAFEEEFEGAEDQTIPDFIQEFQDLGLGPEEGDDDDLFEKFAGVPATHNYAPYGNKTMCYLDILDNLPRLRLSSSQIKMILWIMRECGARDVPSFSAFRKMQSHVRDLCGVKTDPSTSDLGNIFFTTDVRDLISRDWSNPEVAPHIQLYPEDVKDKPISEMWQVPKGRWSEIPREHLPPSILVREKRFYVDEVAVLTDHRWVIPSMWIIEDKIVHADCQLVTRDQQGLLCVIEAPLRVPVAWLCITHEEIVTREGRQLVFSATFKSYADRIPNVNRQIDNGDDLFTIWIPIWADDVSGARSKQYQKHINMYMLNASLPGRLIMQEYFIRFVSTSPTAGALEQFKPVVKQIKSTHTKPVRTWNAATQRPCSFKIFNSDEPADNPQQSEEASHIGHNGKCKCRGCWAGGSAGFEPNAKMYHCFYEAGTPRNVQEIRACVLEQLRLATYGVSSHVEDLQTKTGTKDKIAQYWIDILITKARKLQQEDRLKTKDQISEVLLTWLASQTDQPYNPLLDMPFFDISQDSLVEILHTILLGTEKYTWHGLHTSWTPAQQDLFTIRLQATNTDGLLIPAIRAAYMMQYRNGLIGKHFKTLMQTAMFHAHDLVTPEQQSLLRATGELGPVLWASSIDNMDEYLDDLTSLIDNVLDAFANIDPSKILVKIKLHVLVHLPSQIRRRGPAVRFSTEVFECFNAIFRMCSVLSNHQAPSRDIATKFADLDRVKHILSGGYWKQDSRWVCAGSSVCSLLRKTPILQKHLGWAPPAVWNPGSIRPPPARSAKYGKRTFCKASATLLTEAHNPLNLTTDASDWLVGVHTTATSGDQCRPGSFVVINLPKEYSPAASNGNPQPIIGRIKQILVRDKAATGLVVVEVFEVGEALHPWYGMPVMKPQSVVPNTIVVPSGVSPNLYRAIIGVPNHETQSIQFVFNAQHDCRAWSCDASGTTRQKQEHQESNIIIRTIIHKDDTQFLINTHSLHNGMLLRRFLPRYLTVPRRLYPDRRKHLDELGVEVEKLGKVKQIEKNQKTAETKEKNRAKKAAVQSSDPSTAGRVPEPDAVGATPGNEEVDSTEVGGPLAHGPPSKKRKS